MLGDPRSGSKVWKALDREIGKPGENRGQVVAHWKFQPPAACSHRFAEYLRIVPGTASVHRVHGLNGSRTPRILRVGRTATNRLDDYIRAMLRIVVDYAMWCGVMDVSRNPIELVVVKGVTKRTRQPRSLTVEEFQKLVKELEEPFRTMAYVAVCFGLRASELLALKWEDVDWLNGKLRIERAIVMQNVDEVKTVASRRQMTIAKELLSVLSARRQTTQFPADTDWIFASPIKLGRLPISYPWFWRQLQQAAEQAGISKLGTHSFRHTYRSWLDAVGTPVAVQQKLMRHTDIRTTMNVYGDVVTDEMARASAKVAGLALNGSQSRLQAR
jgi:integrase